MSNSSKNRKKEPEMRKEYDFTNATRGKDVKRFPKDVVMVTLAPDVATAFPDADAVNEALRVVIKAARKSSAASGRKTDRAA
jgi:hypothetical protein